MASIPLDMSALNTPVKTTEHFTSSASGIGTGTQTPLEYIDKQLPKVKQAFSRAVGGVGDFANKYPDIAMIGVFGFALLATPTILNVISHPLDTAKGLGKLAFKLGVALAVGNTIATWAMNPKEGLSGAFARTASNIGDILGVDKVDPNAPPVIKKQDIEALASTAESKTTSSSAPGKDFTFEA